MSERGLVLVSCTAVLLGLSACADEGAVAVPFRIHVAPGDPALEPVDRVEIAIVQDGRELEGTRRVFSAPFDTFPLATLDFGGGFQIEVEAFARDFVISRGTSFPFEVDEGGGTGSADLYLAALGRFGRRDEGPPLPVVAIAPSPDGAIVVLSDGTLLRYRPFSDTPYASIATSADAQARWVSAGERFFVGFGAAIDRVVLLDRRTREETIVTSPLFARHGAGASVVAAGDGAYVVFIGGREGAGSTDPRAVTRLDLSEDGVFAVSALPSLDAGRFDAIAALARGATRSLDRVLVMGGSTPSAPADRLILVDPAGVAAPVDRPQPVSIAGAAVVEVDRGQVAVIGGAASDDVQLLVVDPEAMDPVAIANPAPPPLFRQRSDPRLVRFAPGLVLVLGGTGNDGFPVQSVELVDLRVFPGSVVATGGLPGGVGSPRGALLGDESVYVFDPSGVYGYVPPRGR